MENLIKNILDTNHLVYHDVRERPKEITSFESKIRKGITYLPNEMQDLTGIRIICYSKSDVERTCQIIRDNFEIIRDSLTNKQHNLGTDKMGYSSPLFVVRLSETRSNLPEYKDFSSLIFEIQVRTILQHAWTELEHDDVYKSESASNEAKRKFNLISSILEIADDELEQVHKQAKKSNPAIFDS